MPIAGFAFAIRVRKCPQIINFGRNALLRFAVTPIPALIYMPRTGFDFNGRVLSLMSANVRNGTIPGF